MRSSAGSEEEMTGIDRISCHENYNFNRDFFPLEDIRDLPSLILSFSRQTDSINYSTWRGKNSRLLLSDYKSSQFENSRFARENHALEFYEFRERLEARKKEEERGEVRSWVRSIFWTSFNDHNHRIMHFTRDRGKNIYLSLCLAIHRISFNYFFFNFATKIQISSKFLTSPRFFERRFLFVDQNWNEHHRDYRPSYKKRKEYENVETKKNKIIIPAPCGLNTCVEQQPTNTHPPTLSKLYKFPHDVPNGSSNRARGTRKARSSAQPT